MADSRASTRTSYEFMMTPRQPPLAGRAALAVALMIGFYALSLGVAGACLYVGYRELRTAAHPSGWIVLPALFAGAILWAVFPRFDRFKPPGPRLERDRNPRLFAQIEDIAKGVGQRVPAEVYLTPDVNAWVGERGGLMGLGARRVMGLGLPLLQSMKISHLRGVLAHEFGHYHGGDTRLGPWVYRTYAAIARTVRTLRNKALNFPFWLYGLLFLRITMGVSRRQELAADALAARLVGARAFAEGLKLSCGAGATFLSYVQGEVLPVLNAGFRPPLAAGFDAFLRAQAVARAVKGYVRYEAERRQKEQDPYDTHPPLHDRLAAIGHLPSGDAPPDDPPAASLLEDLPDLEAQLLAVLVGDPGVRRLAPLPWEEVGARVYLPMWEKQLASCRNALGRLTPAGLPEVATRLEQFGRSLDSGPMSRQQAEQIAILAVGSAFAVALSRRGWTVHATPGAEFVMRRSGASVEPFTPLPRMAGAELSFGAWRRQCEDLGIAELALGETQASS